MGREVRRTPPDWQHPEDEDGEFIPLLDKEMPRWTPAEATHYQMYETTSEGTPISPVMDSPETLARWLADNKASAFASHTASYEAWLEICQRGYAPGFIISKVHTTSGVEGMGDNPSRGRLRRLLRLAKRTTR